VKDENGDLHADSYNILNKGKNYLSKLLTVYKVSDVRQIEIYTAEPLVPEPSPFKIEIPIAKLKSYKSPSSDQIPTELIQVGGETLRSALYKLINSISNKEELSDHWKGLLLSQFKRRTI
jgi:hypothetical protein